MKLQAVLFDMDGTLADSEGLHHRALLDVLTALGLEKPAGFDVAMTGQAIGFVHRRLVETLGLPLTLAEFAGAKYDAFLARAPELCWRAGARAAVDAVAKAGLEMAIVTNSDRLLLDATLRALGLRAPDLITVSRNDVREGKPSPEPYLRAAWLLGAEPGRCAVVEDSAAGAASGLAAGMHVFGWPEAGSTTEFARGVRVVAAHELTPALAALALSHESVSP